MKNTALKFIFFCLAMLSAAFSPYNPNHQQLRVEYSNKLRALKQAEAPRPLTLVNLEELEHGKKNISNGLLFTYKNRKAVNVSIAGNFSNWRLIPMKRSVNGIWYYFQSVREDDTNTDGYIKYKFSVDGIWTSDPSNSLQENDGNGSFLSVTNLPSPYFSPHITYRIVGKSNIEFRLYKPEARLISLVGDFNNWNPENDLLKRGKDGIWRLTKRLPAGTYRYIFIIDGKACPDMYNQESASTVNGEICSLITIR